MNSAQSEYTARLNRVIDYIHANLDTPLPLETLAAVAGFSPFHFHRLFKSLTGETLNDYVQRARLEKAANLLVGRPNDTILAIGVACGFSGAAVFSRAFRTRFGLSPSEYRVRERASALADHSKNRKAESNPGKDLAWAAGYNGEHSFRLVERSVSPMNVEVKNLPTYHVAYIRHISGYSKGQFNAEINKAFQRVCAWAGARDLFRPDTVTIGIPYDNPDITPNDRCRYDACVTVPEGVQAEPGSAVGIQDIAGGKYAVCRISVSTQEISKIGEAVDRLYGEWLPESGFEADDKPALEIYFDNPDKQPGTWITMDYCLPVKPM